MSAPSAPAAGHEASRAQLRLRSIAWALAAGGSALLLGLPPLSPWPVATPVAAGLAQVAPTVMMELVRAWLPLIGAALVLHGSQALSRILAARPQAVRRP